MKRLTSIIALLAAFLSIGSEANLAQTLVLPVAKMTIKVVDESGKPVPNAKVMLGFDATPVEGLTDGSGLFVGEGRCNIAGIGSSISKEGFYPGAAPIPRFYKFYKHNEALNCWEPWNHTFTAILRPVEKPVGLYAKTVQTDLPVFDQPCGYDLEAGDWVIPYGKGMKKDLIFTIQNKTVKNSGNFSVKGELTFDNPLDGIEQAVIPAYGSNSVFRWERLAPEKNYDSHFSLENTLWENWGQKAVRTFKFDDKEWEGYFFRVRTVEQDGKVVSAHYGKIRGGIGIEPRETKKCTLTFSYYFNPTPLDRNLEWDRKHNLFGGLSWEQVPHEP